MSIFQLPDMELGDRETWGETRYRWKKAAETCLYGTAPENCSVSSVTLSKEILWRGEGMQQTLLVQYGEDAEFEVLLYAPLDGRKHPAIVWNSFTREPGAECPLREMVVERGYIIACFDREQLMEDKMGGLDPVRQAFPGYSWGAIRAWAYGASMVATMLCERQDVDRDKLVVTGHSRCGKAALAAGIFDERFQVTAPICSGAGGGGCFRYLGDREGFHQDPVKAESLGRVGSAFPYWWSESYSAWWPEDNPSGMGREQDFPLDAHILKALIAPRNLITCDGMEDLWSNPRGSALTAICSSPAFERMGGRSEAFFHEGGHVFGTEDWHALLDFCDEVLLGKPGRDWHSDFLDSVEKEVQA